MATDAADRVPAIEVENVVAHYGSREVLHGVSMQVYRGEIMVIMGGSGSGKSTLLRHLLGLRRPTSGCIRLLGQDITRLSAREMFALRRNMGVSFQGGALFNSMTVRENVELPLREHTKLDRKTMQIISRIKLEVVNLAGFEDLMPAELSGGMIKRAALASAIVMDPQLLFFDEPSAGLDPVVSAELDELILSLREAHEHDDRRRHARAGKRLQDRRSDHRPGPGAHPDDRRARRRSESRTTSGYRASSIGGPGMKRWMPTRICAVLPNRRRST